jgi:hypothetical protein
LGGGSLATGIVLMIGEADDLSGLTTGGGPKPTLRSLNGFSWSLKSVFLPWKKVSRCRDVTAFLASMFLNRRCTSMMLMLMVLMFTLPGP